MPKKKLRERWVRTDDLIAESFESVAKSFPPSEKFEADRWLRVAKKLRASKSKKMTRIREFAVDTKSGRFAPGGGAGRIKIKW